MYPHFHVKPQHLQTFVVRFPQHALIVTYRKDLVRERIIQLILDELGEHVVFEIYADDHFAAFIPRTDTIVNVKRVTLYAQHARN